MEHLAQVTRKIALLGPTRQLICKATLPRLVNIAYLPNTQKFIQGVSQNGEMKKIIPSKSTGPNSRKRTKQNETSNLQHEAFKTLVITIPSEFRGRIDELSVNFNKDIGSIKMKI